MKGMKPKGKCLFDLREVLISHAREGIATTDMLDALADLATEVACAELDHAVERLERVCGRLDTALDDIAVPLSGRERPVQSLVCGISVSPPDEHGNLILSFRSLNGSMRYAARLPTTETLKHAGSIIKAVGYDGQITQ